MRRKKVPPGSREAQIRLPGGLVDDWQRHATTTIARRPHASSCKCLVPQSLLDLYVVACGGLSVRSCRAERSLPLCSLLLLLRFGSARKVRRRSSTSSSTTASAMPTRRLAAFAALFLALSSCSASTVAPLQPSIVARSPELSSILDRAVTSSLSRRGKSVVGVALERGKRQSSSDDPDQTSPNEIYVSYPACGSVRLFPSPSPPHDAKPSLPRSQFRCSVSWPHGLSTFVNWVRPPVGGNVSITLTSNTGGSNYVIAPSVPSISQRGYCDAGNGEGVVIPGRVRLLLAWVLRGRELMRREDRRAVG